MEPTKLRLNVPAALAFIKSKPKQYLRALT